MHTRQQHPTAAARLEMLGRLRQRIGAFLMIAGVVAALISVAGFAHAAEPERRPNIVLVITDDKYDLTSQTAPIL